MEKNFTNALLTTGAVIFLKGITSGNLVATHMIVNKNWLLVLVFGRGPIQSTITCSNGSPIAGIGFKRAGGML